MKTIIRVALVMTAFFAIGGHTAAQVYKVRLVSETSEGQDVVNAVKAKLRAVNRYLVTDESKVDWTLEVECGGQTSSPGYICASTVIFWGQSIYPLPAPISGISLFKGSSAGAVADGVEWTAHQN